MGCPSSSVGLASMWPGPFGAPWAPRGTRPGCRSWFPKALRRPSFCLSRLLVPCDPVEYCVQFPSLCDQGSVAHHNPVLRGLGVGFRSRPRPGQSARALRFLVLRGRVAGFVPQQVVLCGQLLDYSRQMVLLGRLSIGHRQVVLRGLLTALGCPSVLCELRAFGVFLL
jgi:hypothetical protein